MALAWMAAILMIWGLRGEAAYAFSAGPPLDVGDLSALRPGPGHANQWVRGAGALSGSGGVRYSRPLESGSYRLSAIAGNDRLWVQVRVPDGLEGPHFVAPNWFVGRLVPRGSAGLRYRGLAQATRMPADAWLLIDGEAPKTTRWAVGLIALCGAFVAFNAYGLIRLLRPVKDA
jgi:hypothetical protein